MLNFNGGESQGHCGSENGNLKRLVRNTKVGKKNLANVYKLC